jgi:hypothetical protein
LFDSVTDDPVTVEYALPAEDDAPLGLDSILILGSIMMSRRRRWGAGGNSDSGIGDRGIILKN